MDKTVKMSDLKVGLKVKVIKPFMGYQSYFDRGDYTGVQTVIAIDPNGSWIDITSNRCDNSNTLLTPSELDCLELAEPIKLQVGDRVQFNRDDEPLGFKKGGLGTIMQYGKGADYCFVNTDKLNSFNHDDYNGNGLLVNLSKIDFYSRPESKPTEDVKPTVAKWSESDIEFLHANYHRMKPAVIAETLGRSVGSIYMKAHDLNLRTHKKVYFNTEDDKYIIHSLVDGVKPSNIAKALHRRESTIHNRIALLDSKGLIPKFEGVA